MASEKYANDAITTLNGGIDGSQTSLVVTSASLFPAAGQFRIIIDNEIMLVTGVAGTTFTVTRAQEGTSGTTHSDLTDVIQILTKGALDQIFADNYQYDTSANRPSAERAGRIYQASDYPVIHRDNSSTWDTFYDNRLLTLPIPGNFTWTHGGGTATNTNVTNGGTYLSVTSTASGDKMSKFVKSVPSNPYTITSMFIPNFSEVTFVYYGMCWSDGTKLVVFGILSVVTSNYNAMWVAKYNSLTSFNADYVRVTTPAIVQPMTLRIADNSTNRICSYSNDGLNFLDVHSVGRTDFLTATHVGMFVGTNTNATSNGVSSKSEINWLSWKE